MSPDTVLIIGATGQLGSYFAEHYVNDLYNVIGTTRSSRKEFSSNLDQVIGEINFSTRVMDLSDPYSIKQVIAGVKPNIIINCGSNSHVGSSWSNFYNHLESNSIGVFHILEAIKEYCPECRYLGFGSTEEFGANDGSVNENIKLDPKNPYAVSKVCSRNIVKCFREGFGLFAIQHWISNTESRRRSDDFITKKIVENCRKHLISKDYTLTVGNILAEKDFVHVRDVVHGCCRSLFLKNPEEFCFGSGEVTRIFKIIETCYNILGVKFERNFSPQDKLCDNQPLYFSDNGNVLIRYSLSFARPYDFTYQVDYSKAFCMMGWEPKVSFENLVEDLLDV